MRCDRWAPRRPTIRSDIEHPPASGIRYIDYLVGPLLENPHRVGKALRGELTRLHSARVGAYSIVYEIDEDSRTARVISIDHRADIYRPR